MPGDTSERSFLAKTCRSGKQRWAESKPVLVIDRVGSRAISHLGWKDYGEATIPADPADEELMAISRGRLFTDTRRFRSGRKAAAALHHGQAMDYKAQWLRDHTSFKEPQCLFFPSMVPGRRETVKYNYKDMAAARAILLMVKGLPVEGQGKLATHICGNGHLSCVNPLHLRWGSASENMKEAHLHDGPSVFIAGMAPETVRAIRDARKLVKVLALEHGIPAAVVSSIKSDEAWASF